MGEWVGRKERGNKSIERGRRKGREEGNISGREEGRKGNGALLEKEERREGRRKQGKEMEGCWIGQPKGGGVDDDPCVACMVGAFGAPSSSRLTCAYVHDRAASPDLDS